MVKAFFGELDKAVYNTVVYFKNDYNPSWLTDPFICQMIKDIDKSDVLSSGAIASPVMGIIPPTSLSGGVKTLILIWEEPEKVFNASNCGDNCAKWLLKMGEKRDITINLRHIMDFGDKPFELLVLNNNKVAHDMDEVLEFAGGYV